MSARLILSLSASLRKVRRVQPRSAADIAEAQLREREAAAYERGRKAGEEALRDQLLQQRGELVELQNGVLHALRQTVPQVVRETEEALTAVALEVARKLVAGMPMDATLVAASVREAMAQVEENTEFHVYLHPDDLDLLRRANSDLLESQPGAQPAFFHAAPEVSRGGCLVRTRFGVMDGRRETKLELLKKSLAA